MGRPKKIQVEETVAVVEPVVEAPKVEAPKAEKVEETVAVVEPVVEAPKVEAPKAEKLDELAPGQQYFESPEGFIKIGSKDAGRLWIREMNGGRGGWANPKR